MDFVDYVIEQRERHVRRMPCVDESVTVASGNGDQRLRCGDSALVNAGDCTNVLCEAGQDECVSVANGHGDSLL
jgi:hypothetical protein